jgi:hypothetical protein
VIALLNPMGKAKFQLAYDGPALRAGAMDVNELAPALLATADLFHDANRYLNGEKTEVSIKVKSDFKRGSFEIFLIFDQSTVEAAKALIFPASVVSAAALVTFLFGTDAIKKGAVGTVFSVLDLWKQLRGEKPRSVIEDQERKVSIVVTGDGNQINVDSQVAQVYSDDRVRSSISSTLRPVSRPGIKSLKIKRGEKSINEVTKSDLPVDPDGKGTALTHSGADVLEDTREAILRLSRANFEKGKWGFSDGTAQFSADIDDKDFREKLDAHEIGFYKGDLLRVVLKTTQIVTPDNQFHTKYVIEKVLAHIHTPRQEMLIAAPKLRAIEPPD